MLSAGFVAAGFGGDSGASCWPFIFSSNHSPAESVGVQRGSLFHARAKPQAIICGRDSAGRTWGRAGALSILLSGSSQSKTCKPPRASRTADRTRAGRQSEGNALAGRGDIVRASARCGGGWRVEWGRGAGLCHRGILVNSLEHKEKHTVYQERFHFTRSQNNDCFLAPEPGKKQLKMDLEGCGFKERGQ